MKQQKAMNYMTNKQERLQKLIAQSGYCSRRKAETLITAGKVTVDGEVVTELGRRFKSNAHIAIDGKPLTKENKVYYMLYKPSKYLSSVSDDRDRNVVVDLIPSEERIFPIGRLDYDTTGLLLLTNDGEFSNLMIHPRYKIEKVYLVDVKGLLDVDSIRQLEKGLLLDGKMTLPTKVTIKHKDFKKNLTRFEIKIREGRNRQIRRMLEQLGYPVTRLHRKQFAGLTLGGLNPGEYRPLKPYEVITLKRLANTGK